MKTSASSSTTCPSDPELPATPGDAARLLMAEEDAAGRACLIEHCLRRFPVEAFLLLLKDESEHYQNIDPRASFHLGTALVLAAERANQPRHRALGLMATGDALMFLGRYQEAAATLQQAGDAFLEFGDELGWARTRIGWIFVSTRLGRAAEALTILERARAILVAHAAWLRAASLDDMAAYAHRELGQFDQALYLYDRAQATYGVLGAPAEERAARAQANRATLLTAMGDFAPALRLHEEAQAVYARHGNTISVLRQETNIGLVYAAQGHFTRALRHLSGAYAAFDQAGLDANAGLAALDMVECYLCLNRDAEALELAEETVGRFERCGSPTEAGKARYCCAVARARLGHGAQALDLFAQASATFAEAGLLVHQGIIAVQRATLQLEAGHWSAALEEAGRARALFAERGLVVRQAQAALVCARAALGQGDLEQAAGLATFALTLADEREVPWLLHEGHHVLASVARARGDLQGALRQYEQAMAAIDRVQGALAVELRPNFLDDKQAVFSDAIEVSLRLEEPALAFSYLERAKSRALVDYLSSDLEIRMRARRQSSPALLDELARLRAEHHWFSTRLYGTGLRQPEAEDGARPHEQLRAALRDRERRITRLLERLALDRADGLEFRSSGEQQGSAAWPDLDHETVLLEYSFTRVGGSVFVVSQEGLSVVPLPVASDELWRLVHQCQMNLGATIQASGAGASLAGLGRNMRGILATLYTALIAPVAEHLAGRNRLIVVPYGPTHAVPFQALYDGARYLIERVEVSTCPSSQLLRLCVERPRRARSALVVANSDGGRLPGVREEARAVAALLPGEIYVEDQATRATLVTAAPRHGVLHLAAHGEARLDNPTFSHLQLADDQLTTADVFNLELDGALVTLSACETGRVVVTAGDELIGLSRGFLYAGASTLVQSLWRVEDGSTTRLMERFYQALCAGQRKGAALRAAQLALLERQSAHPFSWAAFQLVGDSGAF